jgi:hypothetical protein
MGFKEPFSQTHMIAFCSTENLFRLVASPEEACASGVFQRFSGEIQCPKCVTFHLAEYLHLGLFYSYLPYLSVTIRGSGLV